MPRYAYALCRAQLETCLIGRERVRQQRHGALRGRREQTAGNQVTLQIVERADGAERSHAHVQRSESAACANSQIGINN
jgi:hypothetical protein